MIGIDLCHRPQNRRGGEQIVGGHLDQVHALAEAPRTMVVTATAGVLPAITWASRGGKARTRPGLPDGRGISCHPSIASQPVSCCTWNSRFSR